ncbi:hypothetical protein OLX02_01595 [Novosphingobium sp. KCTC 2891]|uniref:hypothetical protein n=1 Tax=Novosphingobium sp. KCTC 2891 TaxID=2989730 RepID=UPI002223265B|nr:hypothetical protein [Novosphingobium sp. KCTC 2891]MCW1381508.1 hypothetical protein [Novosphingobium sp. KCTC 2891]
MLTMRAPQEIARHRVRRKVNANAKDRRSSLQGQEPTEPQPWKQAVWLESAVSHLDGVPLPSRFLRRLIGARQ